MKPKRTIAAGALALVAVAGIASAHEGESRGVRQLWRDAKAEVKQFFGMRSGAGSSGCPMMGGGQSAMGGGMMGGGMMGGGMMGGMMRGMMGPAQGEALHVARFTVSPGARPRAASIVLPEPEPLVSEASHELRTQLAFRHMRGFLNGRSFDAADMTAVARDERLPLGKTSVWTFANDGGGMSMPHPMHIHGVRFRVIERSGRTAPADLRDGLVDAGFRDTFGIFSGERVSVLVAPTVPGLFMYH